MPIHEYKCTNEECQKFDEEFEAMMKINDSPAKCLKCGEELERLISKSSFHLKGGGWAEDGYSKK